ncbi:uncharacterized protein LOC127704933 [Mytilus californianus]|uniref:uncharacterized protein LOC127704933 n=1 Tax=Mytilus californianus TaxID=6549 RepID=UPI0022457FDB|nr:uncharacterized protein LOC127704933 [Mytilus californianus]
MGTAIDDLQHRMSEFSLMIGKILNVYENNLSSISDQRDEYKEKIRNVRKELNTYLDELEQEIDTKFDTCNEECKGEIKKHIKDLTARKNKSESWQTAIETLTEHTSETRIFAAIKTIDLLQVEEEMFLSKFQEGLVEYNLRSSPFEFIEKIKPILATLSKLKVEKIKTTVQHPLNVQQVHAYKVQQGKHQLLQNIRCSQLEMKVLNKASFTMNNQIVFNGSPFRVYDITSSNVHTINVGYSSSDVTCNVTNDVYASFPPIGVYNIDIKNLKEGPRINKETSTENAYRRVKVNNALIYSNVENAIVLLSQDGTVVKTLQCKITLLFICVDNRGGMFISDGKSIIHMTETGSHKEIPTNMKSDHEIRGLDVSEQGQLYACICHNEKGSVVQINTTTGYREPVLENLVTPRHISFHPTKNIFLIITDKSKECSVYQIRN